jgi:hypothetical protein
MMLYDLMPTSRPAEAVAIELASGKGSFVGLVIAVTLAHKVMPPTARAICEKSMTVIES